MKKYMNRLFVALGAASMLGFTGCIEETFPTDMATPDQVSSSSQSLQYMTNSLPAYIVTKAHTAVETSTGVILARCMYANFTAKTFRQTMTDIICGNMPKEHLLKS